MKSSFAWIFVSLLSTGCTFPEIGIGAGGRGTSGAATSASGSPQTVSGSGATVTGGTTNTTIATTATGMDACQACLNSPTCDCDNDMIERYDPAHGCTNVMDDPTKKDCNDCNADVFPGQTVFFPNAISPNNWDYNCDGTSDPEFKTGTCSAFAPLNGGCAKAFAESAPKCGTVVSVDHCGNDSVITNPCIVANIGTQAMPCR